MKVVGISGSGRKNGYSSEVVQDILGVLDCETEFISLAGKRINGCIGCLQCTADNICSQKDDFTDILNQIIAADVLVFAGPNYYGSVNALSAAFWERTFCLRHQDQFLLAGKLAVAVGLDRQENGPALKQIVKMMKSNKMEVVATYSNAGNYQCYDCGHGHECYAGNVYSQQGLCTQEFAREHRPLEYAKDSKAKQQVKAIGKYLNEILEI